ncbi:MAG: glycosyltransferase family 4 protein [Akkermansiaceae bacterium]
MTRILYSFPFGIGGGRIASTAWQQVQGAADAGAEMTVLAAWKLKEFSADVSIKTTLSRGRFRIPYRVLGRARACALHDRLVAKWLRKNRSQIDVFHGWPLASLESLKAAKELGIKCVLERPNTHTEYAYEAAAMENEHLGIALPAGHDHAFNQDMLDLEVREYASSDYLLCPSEFVARTFKERDFSDNKLLRHRYGYDGEHFYIGEQNTDSDGLDAIYVGVCEPRKGLHYALEAWLASKASENGVFRICGEFVPGYAEKLSVMLSHPSVQVLGHRTDVDELMRASHLFILSSVEEGSALVTYEARGSGCVLLVSDAAGAVCEHGKDGLVHPMRSVETLTQHLDSVCEDRALLAKLRQNSLELRAQLNWAAAGEKLVQLYQEVAIS